MALRKETRAVLYKDRIKINAGQGLRDKANRANKDASIIDDSINMYAKEALKVQKKWGAKRGKEAFEYYKPINETIEYKSEEYSSEARGPVSVIKTAKVMSDPITPIHLKTKSEQEAFQLNAYNLYSKEIDKTTNRIMNEEVTNANLYNQTPEQLHVQMTDSLETVLDTLPEKEKELKRQSLLSSLEDRVLAYKYKFNQREITVTNARSMDMIIDNTVVHRDNILVQDDAEQFKVNSNSTIADIDRELAMNMRTPEDIIRLENLKVEIKLGVGVNELITSNNLKLVTEGGDTSVAVYERKNNTYRKLLEMLETDGNIEDLSMTLDNGEVANFQTSKLNGKFKNDKPLKESLKNHIVKLQQTNAINRDRFIAKEITKQDARSIVNGNYDPDTMNIDFTDVEQRDIFNEMSVGNYNSKYGTDISHAEVNNVDVNTLLTWQQSFSQPLVGDESPEELSARIQNEHKFNLAMDRDEQVFIATGKAYSANVNQLVAVAQSPEASPEDRFNAILVLRNSGHAQMMADNPQGANVEEDLFLYMIGNDDGHYDYKGNLNSKEGFESLNYYYPLRLKALQRDESDMSLQDRTSRDNRVDTVFDDWLSSSENWSTTSMTNDSHVLPARGADGRRNPKNSYKGNDVLVNVIEEGQMTINIQDKLRTVYMKAVDLNPNMTKGQLEKVMSSIGKRVLAYENVGASFIEEEDFSDQRDDYDLPILMSNPVEKLYLDDEGSVDWISGVVKKAIPEGFAKDFGDTFKDIQLGDNAYLVKSEVKGIYHLKGMHSDGVPFMFRETSGALTIVDLDEAYIDLLGVDRFKQIRSGELQQAKDQLEFQGK